MAEIEYDFTLNPIIIDNGDSTLARFWDPDNTCKGCGGGVRQEDGWWTNWGTSLQLMYTERSCLPCQWTVTSSESGDTEEESAQEWPEGPHEYLTHFGAGTKEADR